MKFHYPFISRQWLLSCLLIVISFCKSHTVSGQIISQPTLLDTPPFCPGAKVRITYSTTGTFGSPKDFYIKFSQDTIARELDLVVETSSGGVDTAYFFIPFDVGASDSSTVIVASLSPVVQSIASTSFQNSGLHPGISKLLWRSNTGKPSLNYYGSSTLVLGDTGTWKVVLDGDDSLATGVRFHWKVNGTSLSDTGNSLTNFISSVGIIEIRMDSPESNCPQINDTLKQNVTSVSRSRLDSSLLQIAETPLCLVPYRVNYYCNQILNPEFGSTHDPSSSDPTWRDRLPFSCWYTFPNYQGASCDGFTSDFGPNFAWNIPNGSQFGTNPPENPVGDGSYAGLCTYWAVGGITGTSSTKIEYLAQNLTGIIPGIHYYIGFDTRLNSSAPFRSQIGALLADKAAIDYYRSSPAILATPSVASPSTVSNSTSWSRIEGIAPAPSNANVLLIGRFIPSQSSNPWTLTGLQNRNLSIPRYDAPYSAYYFVDNVELVEGPSAGFDRHISCGGYTTLGKACSYSPYPHFENLQYTWSIPGGSSTSLYLDNEHVARPVATPPVTTTYRLTVTYEYPVGTPHTYTDDVTVTVDPDPSSLTFTIPCGGSVNLGGVMCAGFYSSATSVFGSWTISGSSSTTTLTNPNQINAIATPTSIITEYEFTGSYVNSIGVTIPLHIFATINTVGYRAGINKSICRGGETELGSACGSIISGITYSWSPSAGLSSSSIPNPVARPCSTTTYTLTSTYGGYTGTTQCTVSVENACGWGVPNSLSLSCPQYVTLGEGELPTGSVSCVWTDELGNLVSNQLNPTIYVSSTHTYKMILNLLSPISGVPYCTWSDEIVISVTTPTLTRSVSVTCGSLATLDLGCNPIDACIQWYPTDGLSNPFASSTTASVKAPTTIYYARVSYPNGEEDLYKFTVSSSNSFTLSSSYSVTASCTEVVSIGAGCLMTEGVVDVSPREGWISGPHGFPVVFQGVGANRTYTVTISDGISTYTSTVTLTNPSGIPSIPALRVIPDCADGAKIRFNDGDSPGKVTYTNLITYEEYTVDDDYLSMYDLDDGVYSITKVYQANKYCIAQSGFYVLGRDEPVDNIFNDVDIFVKANHNLAFNSLLLLNGTHMYVDGMWDLPGDCTSDPIFTGYPIIISDGDLKLRGDAKVEGICGKMWAGFKLKDGVNALADCDRCNISDALTGLLSEGEYNSIDLTGVDFVGCLTGAQTSVRELAKFQKCLFSAPFGTLGAPYNLDALYDNYFRNSCTGDPNVDLNYGGRYGIYANADQNMYSRASNVSCTCNHFEGLNVGFYGLDRQANTLTQDLHTRYNIAGIALKTDASLASTYTTLVSRNMLLPELNPVDSRDRSNQSFTLAFDFPSGIAQAGVQAEYEPVTLINNSVGHSNSLNSFQLTYSVGVSIINTSAQVFGNTIFSHRIGLSDRSDELSDIKGNQFDRNSVGIYRETSLVGLSLRAYCNKFITDYGINPPYRVGIEFNQNVGLPGAYIGKFPLGSLTGTPYCGNVFPSIDQSTSTSCFNHDVTSSSPNFNIECDYPGAFSSYASPAHWTSIKGSVAGLDFSYYRYLNEFVGNIDVNTIKVVNASGLSSKYAFTTTDRSSPGYINTTLLPGQYESACGSVPLVNDGVSYFPAFTRRGVQDSEDSVDHSDGSDLSFYPNPVRDFLYTESISDVSFNILNVSGVTIAKGLISSSRPLDTRSLPAGIYQLTLMNDKRTVFKRFVKL